MSESNTSHSVDATLAPSRIKKVWSFTWKQTKRLCKMYLFSLPIQFIALYWGYQEYVVRNPGPNFSEEYITNFLTQDSPIYYRDGITIMNAYLGSGNHIHRYYVEYEEIPKHWINAIVAMEDKNFWTHYGIEPIGIGKAIYRNLQGTRSGGSTLTQQTAKNLFDRDLYQKETEERLKKILTGENTPRSKGIIVSAKLMAKLWEALNALRLEAHFSKRQILEYYANQFQVHGTGRGLGIAAKYFFDKPPAELTLPECAFLAAIVKGPNNYNPFTKTTEETKEETLKKALGRTQTVLNRMLEDGYITQEERDAVYHEELPFSRGHFRYESSTVFDLVQKELEHPAIKKKLEEAGILNIATAGLHIRTTIDEEIQRKTEYALRHKLTELSGKIDDYPPNAPLRRPSGLRPQLSKASKPYQFFEGIVSKEGTTPTVDIGGEECVLSKESMNMMEKLLPKPNLHTYLKKYSRILVSKNEDTSCSIELDGNLEGGILATQKGMIRAVVGGRKNEFLNRAFSSKLQLGSTWKPLIYASALQLGWSMIDQLDNYHTNLYYNGKWFFPKGHYPNESLSMMWTGVLSENRASTWLLYHLTDRLPIDRQKELASYVGMTQQEGESKQEYKERLRKWGIQSTPAWREGNAFRKAQREVLLSMEEGEEKIALMSLNFITPLMEAIGKKDVQDSEEKKHNKEVLEYHYTNMKTLWEQCSHDLEPIQKRFEKGIKKQSIDIFSFVNIPIPSAPLPKIPSTIYWHPLEQRIICGQAKETIPLTWENLSSFQDEATEESKEVFPPIWIQNRISVQTYFDLTEKMNLYVEEFSALDLYDLDYLLFHNDFLRQTNMRFVDKNLQRLGLPVIEDTEKNRSLGYTPEKGYLNSSIPLVLSMTLGSVDIPLTQINQIYEGILSGVQYRHKEIDHPIIIDQIIDETGTLLYKAEIEKQEVFDSIIGKQIAHMLRNVVEKGTGVTAKDKIKHNNIDIPVLGKTGTTNNYKISAFVGLIPYATESDQWNFEEGIALSSYVGFDCFIREDCRMRTPKGKTLDNTGKKNLRTIDGSRGALPIWIETAKALSQSNLLGSPSVQIPWNKSDSFSEYPDVFIKNNKEQEIINWFYSEDKENVFRMLNINDNPVVLQKKPPYQRISEAEEGEVQSIDEEEEE